MVVENLTNATFTTSASDTSTPAFSAWKALADAAEVPASDPFVPNSYDAVMLMALAIEKAGSADRAGIAAALRSVANAPGEQILPGEFAKAKAILAGGGDIHYVGAAGPQDFDANGDVAGFFSRMISTDIPSPNTSLKSQPLPPERFRFVPVTGGGII